MAWWLLPAIGAIGGALTNLNNPKQTWKNALLGAGLGFGVSQIPGATEGATKFLGIGGSSTVPLETSTGAATKLSSPAIDKFMSLSGNPITDMKILNPPTFWDKTLNFLKSPQYIMGAGSLFNQMNQAPQPNPNANNLVLGGGMQPMGRPMQQQQSIDSGIYSKDFKSPSPFRNFKLGLDHTLNTIDRYYPPIWRGRY